MYWRSVSRRFSTTRPSLSTDSSATSNFLPFSLFLTHFEDPFDEMIDRAEVGRVAWLVGHRNKFVATCYPCSSKNYWFFEKKTNHANPKMGGGLSFRRNSWRLFQRILAKMNFRKTERSVLSELFSEMSCLHKIRPWWTDWANLAESVFCSTFSVERIRACHNKGKEKTNFLGNISDSKLKLRESVS